MAGFLFAKFDKGPRQLQPLYIVYLNNFGIVCQFMPFSNHFSGFFVFTIVGNVTTENTTTNEVSWPVVKNARSYQIYGQIEGENKDCYYAITPKTKLVFNLERTCEADRPKDKKDLNLALEVRVLVGQNNYLHYKTRLTLGKFN